tara:strand:+ start:3285 stop:3911 length:627 start_codon:yes stop_codon:yes gene_type:complete
MSNIENFYDSNTNFFKKHTLNDIPDANQEPINTNNNFNGRLFIDPNQKVEKYDLYKDSSKEQNNFKNTLNYNHEDTPLSVMYFSKNNVEQIQQDIKLKVYQITKEDNDPLYIKSNNNNGIVISRQDDLQLQIIMRSIYLQYAKNMNSNINEQINELNQLVIKECIPTIITGIKQHLLYIADIQKYPMPMDHSVNTSSSGDNTFSLYNY